MNAVLGAGKRLAADDVAALSRPISNCLTIEETSLQRLDDLVKNVAKEVVVSVETGVPTTNDASVAVSPCIVRAGLICRIVALLSGRTAVRRVLVQTLAELVNHQVTPLLTSIGEGPQQLVAFLEGSGFALHNGNVIAAVDALTIVGASAMALIASERAALLDYPYFASGLGCIVITAAQQVSRSVDPISALSCEAIGANLEAFDPAVFETNRQHRGQMHSATNLKALFEGSKRVVFNFVAASDSFAALHTSPQSTGPALDMLQVAAKALDIEINSTEVSALARGQTVSSAQIAVVLQSAGLAIQRLIDASAARSQALKAEAGVAEAVQPSNVAAQPFEYQLVVKLVETLATETLTSLKALQNVEDTTERERAEKEKREEASENHREKTKPDTDDSNLTAEQRAKAEAKRKAKAEKAAAKAAAKEQRRGGAVVVGAGSASVRSLLSAFSPEDLVAHLSPTALPTHQTGETSLLDDLQTAVESLLTGGKRKPKIAKGTRDYTPEQMRIREQAFNTIRSVFKRHGGVEIDTPVFELKEVLTGKYGEDSKLIYDMADQGGELLALRYDLTVPFARFLAMYSVGNIKRYHMAKVYRRDNPVLSKGRYREFYQCDFDIAGSYNAMVPDAEVITIATEILSALPIGAFLIKLNHRKLLDAIFEIAGVPASKFRAICSSVDKLDKMSWEEVKHEMVSEKGLAADIADTIGTFVLFSGPPKALWAQLDEKGLFHAHAGASEAMRELRLLFDYLDAMGSLQYISFDLSLARGLDYYTGVIYEAVLVSQGGGQVGSIAAGGRYDQLVGMFSPSGTQTPCVGISIGVERVFTIMERRAEAMKLMQSSHVEVYVASIGAGLVPERMRVARALWQANISAEYSHLDNPKFKKQLDEALERGMPFMVVFGSEELAAGRVKVKDMRAKEEVEVAREDMVAELVRRGARVISAGDDSFIQALKSVSL